MRLSLAIVLSACVAASVALPLTLPNVDKRTVYNALANIPEVRLALNEQLQQAMANMKKLGT